MKLDNAPKQNRDQDATLINIDALKKRVEKLEAEAKVDEEFRKNLRDALSEMWKSLG